MDSFIRALKPDEYKLVHKLRKQVAQLMNEYRLIEPDDKVMACLSGGKDSYTMLDMLLYMQKKVPFRFDIVAVNLDQKQPGYPEHVLPEYLSKLGVEFHIIERDTYSIVKEKTPEGKTMCSLCSRLRRGTLYAKADEIGATKIALGHHKDDVVETFMLNLFFSGKLEAMPALYRTDDGKHVVIRPLVYCREKDIEQYARMRNFPIIPCNLCGSQENLQRKKIKHMLQSWEKEYANRTDIIFTALHNIHPSHLYDKNFYDFIQFKHNINSASF
ncbi:MAG: tRNA 2-thiocytidine(32) synthetase TtcA [Cytophagaceae bacterium]|nr:tRNA 2-thiocytidine(32) synthetase TtcA [Cytophagaceae bacterium]MDW8455803.1 tRNA 2-thiocytidine(32) synthetase TtcA [Cytophagaceae bacterium]